MEKPRTDRRPEQVVADFFEFFNAADRDSLNAVWDSPCVFITGSQTKQFDRYADAVSFQKLKEEGWSYSRIHSSELVFEEETLAMVKFDFSRFDESDKVIATYDVTHLLVKKDNRWRIKVLYLTGSKSMSGIT
ncbi:MAG: nuclear transport factor 2 family protein [Woeseiaceae bacterium]